MVLVKDFLCPVCRQQKYEIVTSSRVCRNCQDALDTIAENAHMEELALAPLEERIRRVELQLYRLNADSRLKAIEVRNMIY